MARRFHPRSTPAENMRLIIGSIPWKLLLLLPVILIVAIPTYLYGARLGNRVVPSITNFFYVAGGPPAPPTPTPLPAFPTVMPQVGSVLYTVQEGDSCDSILTFQMRMADAGQIFSDVKPDTVKALDAVMGQDCHAVQPGMVLPLSPQYPLIAFGGEIIKINASTPQEVLPTPLINVPQQQQLGADCSSSCLLTVRLAPQVQVRLYVQTTLPVRVGSWIWTRAMLARKVVKNFDNYPYADPTASLDGMSLHACDVQIDNTYDNNSLSCDQITPNTIDDDGGSWLFGVTGPSALGHWGYQLHLPPGTQVLIWLTGNNGTLKFQKGNPVYRYDDASHVYVPA